MKKFDSKKNNKARGPKPVVKVLPFVVTGKDQKGNAYDTESCYNIMADLQDAGCFDMLSVNVSITRDKLINDAKGITVLGRLQKFDIESGNIELLLIGKNTEYAELVNDMVIVPRVRLAYNSTEVSSILSFEVVPAMEA